MLIKEIKQIFEAVKYFNQQQLTLPTNCKDGKNIFIIFISFIPLACAECNNSLPFPGASSIPLCYVLFPATLLHQLFFHPLSPHLAIYFLVCLSILLFPYSYIIPFWEFYFLPFSIHAQTNVISVNVYNILNPQET